MKKYNYSLLALLVILIWSCTKEPIGQYPIDSIPPMPVSAPSVENFPGGATISYDLPEEDDLLYIKITYQLPNGEIRTNKASAFNNSITLKGFGKSEKQVVGLVSVDSSQNESEPVYVEIEPEDSPIYSIIDGMEFVESFGGFKLIWSNPLKEEIVVGVLKKQGNQFDYVDNFYSSIENALFAVRGQDSIPSIFGIYVRDSYENCTDTFLIDLKPLFEQQLDKNLFVSMGEPSVFIYKNVGGEGYWVGPMSRMWDGVINVDKNMFYIEPGGSIQPYFTFDLGVKAKLSRFRLWGRYDFFFSLHNPKTLEIWGTNDQDVAADGTTQGWENNPAWIKLLDGESKRPSGLGTDEALTDEDIAYAAAGEEFEFPLDAPSMRYIRFRSLISWGGSLGLHINELTFWGQVEH